ncbi:DUF6879 family protein [Allonocardiopsis opalescens]|uniref:DUF6879 domain-containing protein n=1 Tax=Allonocardiopsis opalescens TaxID=1144618 RepID=A0A2T0PYT3_9ACTN|nr:DUF6879 family protein [Allonocardiopsis opalescens]PRX96678.1 hypothetical protein CLV72_107201 [Allonocardiopsis opalescens]
MNLVSSEQRDALIDRVELDAFRLELRDTYQVSLEDGPYADWLAGRPDDHAWMEPWLARIRRIRGRGARVRRVRVVTEPWTDYIRWEHETTPVNLAAGEDIRWLPRHTVPAGVVWPCGGRDWWLLDGRMVAVSHVDGDGRIAGVEVVRHRPVVAECVRLRDLLWDSAIPHDDYSLR